MKYSRQNFTQTIIDFNYLFSVATSFGYQGGEPSNQAGTGAVPPSYR